MKIPHDGSLGTSPSTLNQGTLTIVYPKASFLFVNAGIHAKAIAYNLIFFLIQERRFLSEAFALFNRSSLGYISVICFFLFRDIDDEYIVKISTGIVEHAFEVTTFRFVKVIHKIPLIII